LYDPSFLGAYGRLRQQEMLADAKRRAARRKANPARAHGREQRAERRRRWYLPMPWRSGVRVRREPSESDLPPNIGLSICVGCAREENVNNPAAVNESAHAGAAEVVFEAGQTSHLDVLDFLSQVRRPCCSSKRARRHCRLDSTRLLPHSRVDLLLTAQEGPQVTQADDVAGVFADTASVLAGLAAAGYLADDKIAGVVSLAARLGKPLLIEGPAGTGKTQLAKSVAMMADRPLIRLQCYEGIDESKALYEWDYRKQLLWIQAARGDETFSADAVIETGKGIFDERFLLTRPMLEAIRSPQPTVLLVDEVDRVDAETEALFLEVLAEHQVSVPELGRLEARHVPLVFLTSNNTRDLSEALKRRCLFLYLDYPAAQREREIVSHAVPGLARELVDRLVGLVETLRRLNLKKPPSISETIDLARTLHLLGATELDVTDSSLALNVLLKYRDDVQIAEAALTPREWKKRP
jgi:MoxR-like ATPase